MLNHKLITNCTVQLRRGIAWLLRATLLFSLAANPIVAWADDGAGVAEECLAVEDLELNYRAGDFGLVFKTQAEAIRALDKSYLATQIGLAEDQFEIESYSSRDFRVLGNTVWVKVKELKEQEKTLETKLDLYNRHYMD